MTAPQMPIGEDDLTALADDRLPAERRPVVAAYLAAHPDVALRVEADMAQRDALRASLAAKFNEPVPSRLRIANIAASRRARLTTRLRLVAASLLLLAIGAAGGWGLRALSLPGAPEPPAAISLAGAAFDAYRTFVVEVAHPVEVRAENEAHLIGWLSKRIGKPLKAPDLGRFGFRLMGGRVLPASSGAAAMLMYDNDLGARLTVYIRADKGAETAFQFRREGDVSTFMWLDRGFGFAISAPLDRTRLLPIAEAVYKETAA